MQQLPLVFHLLSSSVSYPGTRFLFTKLTSIAFGFFNAYGNPVRKDSVDYVLHLGDYLYEYKNGDYGWGNSIDRIPQPDHEIYT